MSMPALAETLTRSLFIGKRRRLVGCAGCGAIVVTPLHGRGAAGVPPARPDPRSESGRLAGRAVLDESGAPAPLTQEPSAARGPITPWWHPARVVRVRPIPPQRVIVPSVPIPCRTSCSARSSTTPWRHRAGPTRSPSVHAVASGGQAEKIRDALAQRIDDAVVLDIHFQIPLAYPEDLRDRRRATGFGLYEVLGIERTDRAARDHQTRKNFEFFGAPTAIFVFVHEGLGAYSVLDAGFMMQTLLLSAHSRGLGTCAQGALAVWVGPVRAEFEVPNPYGLRLGVSLGYASDHPVNQYAPSRPSVDEILLPAVGRC